MSRMIAENLDGYTGQKIHEVDKIIEYRKNSIHMYKYITIEPLQIHMQFIIPY